MLAFPSSWRVYLAVEPVDMRKHFDGLAGPGIVNSFRVLRDSPV